MTEEQTFLPWHLKNLRLLNRARKDQRLPHALLLTGAPGVGKGLFAEKLSQLFLCDSDGDNENPCGVCQSCRLFQAGTHPSYTRIEPEEPGKAIKIDVIREYTGKEFLTSRAGGYKITIIEPADAMNNAASNSLLKTLEEPVSNTLIVLVSSSPGKLPATIRSRCQIFNFPSPDHGQAISWLSGRVEAGDPELLLALASGAPLQALQMDKPEVLGQRLGMLDEFCGVIDRKQDPVSVAAKWDKQEPRLVLQWLAGWVIDMIRLKVDGRNSSRLINPDQPERLKRVAASLELKVLYSLLDQVFDAISKLGTQLNTLMLLEGLLISWAGKGDRNKR
jgi:DNA polymerase-3 subunit delta'